MANDNSETAGPSPGTGTPSEKKRERSTIEFPYSDLEAVVEVARVLNERAGDAPCEDTQLAGWMNQTASGGTFRTRMGAAKMFGLIESAQGKLSLTTEGRNTLDDRMSKAALVDAFLRVPLYLAMYEKYQGYALPPAAAIERQMEALGVSSKVKDRARQAFSKSAQFAGFIDPQTNRFIKPAVTQGAAPTLENDDRSGKSKGGGGGDNPPLHPFIQGLLKTLPEPESEWSVQDRAKWLQTAASIFGLIYKGDGDVSVTCSPHREGTG